ncbi:MULTISPECIES: PilW family protein [unclassified Marinobacter]|uniref:PilW family protein n=1 Tax=unclassified Marinobacter TaxID=83889 RepID=UPI0012A92AAF|nr:MULTISPECIES: PilW family protein [unclassified Marinobacter]QFS85893.1 hypothetical protein FIV08_03470 [Marinobacter sp. THAF197a]QFT49687.1 hypothetical protein FIU96_03465 [Marinobacter sp. THAF39]
MSISTFAPSNMSKPKQSGLSLIELMIAVVLGLLLIAGVINIFLGTQQTNRTQEALARVQETGRFAVEILSRQAREAGMNGCPAGSVNNLLDPNGTGYDAASMAGSEPFSFIDPDDLDGHVRGHVLTINGARRLDLNLEASGNGSAGGGGQVPPINLTSSNGIAKGTIITVVGADGYTCDLFQTGSAQNANNLQRSTNDNPGNLSVSQARGVYSAFFGPIEVFEMASSSYYIRNNPAGIPSLYVLSRGDLDEVVEGVYDMRLEYGIDSNGNGRVNQYVNHESMTANQWEQAATIRIHLLAYNGEEGQVLETAQTGLLFRDSLFNAPDNRLYQVFTTTVAVRNMVL